MNMNKQNIEEWAEYGVDSRYKSREEQKADSIALMEARLERMKTLPKEQIIRARLMQVKLKMERFLKESVPDNVNHFTAFVAAYIDVLYSKRNDFADDISVTPVFLSQVINNHREPNEEFILKLMIHSEKAFRNISGFNKKMWYEIYFHQKLSNTLSSQDQWRPEIEKQVRFREVKG
ncbi:hypothetical protein FQZ97_982710 [compost metagenome]